eukprot:362355-Chlamydomonas_euryale.AAC.5
MPELRCSELQGQETGPQQALQGVRGTPSAQMPRVLPRGRVVDDCGSRVPKCGLVWQALRAPSSAHACAMLWGLCLCPNRCCGVCVCVLTAALGFVSVSYPLLWGSCLCPNRCS